MEMETEKKKSAPERLMLMSIGEEDYWQNILVRLPVETLCRFKSVCKSWNCLISSPFFINLQRSFSSRSEVYNLRSDVHFPFQFRLPVLIPENDNYLSINVVDVVSGLVCVSYSLDSTFDSNIIWNPAIHRYMTLPHLPFPSHIDSLVRRWTLASPEDEALYCVEEFARFYSNAIGFGYDRVTDDFKVVRIWLNSPDVEMRAGYIPTTYEVYSTKQGKWRMVIAESIRLSLTIDFAKIRSGCFMDGRIHWLVETEDWRMNRVLVFDCATEQVSTMDLPEELYEPKPSWGDPNVLPVGRAELLEYGGMLTVMVERRWEVRTELWAMNKNNMCWSKVFILDNHCDVLEIYNPSFLKLLAPNEPREWIMFHKYVARFHQVFAYKETMLLMDEPQAKAYSRNQTLDINIHTCHIPPSYMN